MPQTYSQGYALIIGVGADLPVTVDDAQAISGMLLDPSRCAYPRNHVRLLVSENARRDGIVSSLEWLAESVGANDTAIVYFSGHGIETPDFHLVPYGFDWDDLDGTAVAGAEFTRLLRSIKSGKLLVLLDCCHAGGQAEAKVEAQSKYFVQTPLPPGALEELGRSGGRVVIASSRKDEVSWTGRPYSQFTMALLEALAGYGAFEQDGFARILDLAMYVGRRVPERTNDKQHPIIKVNNLEDNFAVAYYAAGDGKPKALSWSAADATTAVPNADDRQVQAWRRMLANHRESLLLIEQRMSEYVLSTDVPLQLLREKRQSEEKINQLEGRLGGGHHA
jgi:uncharacterized caspase-like protein